MKNTLERKEVARLQRDDVFMRFTENVSGTGRKPRRVIEIVLPPSLRPDNIQRAPRQIFPAEQDIGVEDRLIVIECSRY